MWQPSFWEKDTLLRPANLLVVGSGLTGLGAALHWKQRRPNDRVVVLERGLLPSGASTRNAGFACFGSPTELLDDLAARPADEVWALVAKRWEGLHYLRELLGDAALQYQSYGGYELFTEADTEAYIACRSALPELNKNLHDITGEPTVFRGGDEQISSFGLRDVAHLLVNTLEGQLHPGKMMSALLSRCRAMGAELITGAEVTDLAEKTDLVEVPTRTGPVFSARQVLVATNGFARYLLDDLPLHPARNQVVLTSPVPGLKLRGAFHYDRGYYYFRNLNGRLLIGGGRHLHPEQEQTAEFGLTNNILQPLRAIIERHLLPADSFRIEHSWSGILGVGPQKSPVFRWEGERTFVAVRLGGMGVALGARLGRDAAEQILQNR